MSYHDYDDAIGSPNDWHKSRRVQHTRTEHKCQACLGQRTIPVGSPAIVEVGKFDDEFYSHYSCVPLPNGNCSLRPYHHVWLVQEPYFSSWASPYWAFTLEAAQAYCDANAIEYAEIDEEWIAC